MKKSLLIVSIALPLVVVAAVVLFKSMPSPTVKNEKTRLATQPQAPLLPPVKKKTIVAPPVEAKKPVKIASTPDTQQRPQHHNRAAIKTTSVVWRTDFDGALKEARETGLPVFVDFYTDWCGACKYLDKTTYQDAKFVRASRNWVMVKVNAEKGARNIQVAKQYRPEGFPTLLMLDMHGKKLNMVAGAYPTFMMLSEMQKAEKQMGVLSAQNPTSPTVG